MKKEIETIDVIRTLIHEQSSRVTGKARAGVSGKAFEAIVYILKDLGFCEYSYQEYLQLLETSELRKINSFPKRYIVTNVPYESLLAKHASKSGFPKKNGKNFQTHTEFVIYADDAKSTEEFPLTENEKFEARIECKWQEVSGTTQQKLVFTTLDLHYGPQEKRIILLVEGAGFGRDLKSFVKEICENRPEWKGCPDMAMKQIRMMNCDDFISWANTAFV